MERVHVVSAATRAATAGAAERQAGRLPRRSAARRCSDVRRAAATAGARPAARRRRDRPKAHPRESRNRSSCRRSRCLARPESREGAAGRGWRRHRTLDDRRMKRACAAAGARLGIDRNEQRRGVGKKVLQPVHPVGYARRWHRSRLPSGDVVPARPHTPRRGISAASPCSQTCWRNSRTSPAGRARARMASASRAERLVGMAGEHDRSKRSQWPVASRTCTPSTSRRIATAGVASRARARSGAARRST